MDAGYGKVQLPTRNTGNFGFMGNTKALIGSLGLLLMGFFHCLTGLKFAINVIILLASIQIIYSSVLDLIT